MAHSRKNEETKPLDIPIKSRRKPLDIPGNNDDFSITITTALESTTYSASLGGDQNAQLDIGQLPTQASEIVVNLRGATFRFSTTPEPEHGDLPHSPYLSPGMGKRKDKTTSSPADTTEKQRYLIPSKSPHVSSSLLVLEDSDEDKDKFDENVPINDDPSHIIHIRSALREQRQSALGQHSEPQQDWCSWASNGISNSFQAFADNVDYALEHPCDVATSFITSGSVVALAAITAAPPALNSLAMPSGESPDKIGPEWWAKMSDLLRAFSVVNAASSLGINFIMNKLFLPTAWNKFKSTITHTFDSPKDFLDNIFSIVFGLGGAVAAAAIAYNAFLWLPMGYVTAAVPALISFAVTLASRYIGVKNVFKRIHNWFNADADSQAKFVDALEHIDEKYLDEIQERFVSILEGMYNQCELYTSNIEPNAENIRSLPFTTNTAYVRYQDNFYYVNKLAKECTLLPIIKGSVQDLPSVPSSQFRQLTREELEEIYKLIGHSRFNQPLTAAEFEHVAEKLADVLTQLADAHPDLIRDTATAEYIAKYAGMIFDFTFAVGLIGYPAGLTFLQKGFDGINTGAKFAGADLNTLNPWLKRLIGAIPALASGMMYSDAGSKLRAILFELANHVYQNPKDLPFAILLLIANGFSATGPFNVAVGVAANKDNVIGVSKDTPYATLFTALNAIGGGVVNGTASIYKAFLSTNKDVAHVQLEDLTKHLSKVNDNLVSRNTADHFILFQSKVSIAKKYGLDSSDEPSLRRTQSTFM